MAGSFRAIRRLHARGSHEVRASWSLSRWPLRNRDGSGRCGAQRASSVCRGMREELAHPGGATIKSRSVPEKRFTNARLARQFTRIRHRFFPPKKGMAAACFIHDAARRSSRSSMDASSTPRVFRGLRGACFARHGDQQPGGLGVGSLGRRPRRLHDGCPRNCAPAVPPWTSRQPQKSPILNSKSGRGGGI